MLTPLGNFLFTTRVLPSLCQCHNPSAGQWSGILKRKERGRERREALAIDLAVAKSASKGKRRERWQQ